ncbi:proline-rich protein 2-like [Canis lupus familiaris]|uniref:proline-rich protein 2-like n=1 Tax=Canis lupus familiaris TaxID=9615 RepID=UPI0018F79D55|nr:proline-rich protein 2-like [Canis lupus familiaris]
MHACITRPQARLSGEAPGGVQVFGSCSGGEAHLRVNSAGRGRRRPGPQTPPAPLPPRSLPARGSVCPRGHTQLPPRPPRLPLAALQVPGGGSLSPAAAPCPGGLPVLLRVPELVGGRLPRGPRGIRPPRAGLAPPGSPSREPLQALASPPLRSPRQPLQTAGPHQCAPSSWGPPGPPTVIPGGLQTWHQVPSAQAETGQRALLNLLSPPGGPVQRERSRGPWPRGHHQPVCPELWALMGLAASGAETGPLRGGQGGPGEGGRPLRSGR